MPSSPKLVIIIGAGPVGLGAALELARFGVRSVVVEKHGGVATHPKARNFNTRTMEIARAWGPVVYGRLRGIDTPDGWKSPIRFLESATGREFGQIDTQGFVGPGPDITPPGQSCRRRICLSKSSWTVRARPALWICASVLKRPPCSRAARPGMTASR